MTDPERGKFFALRLRPDAVVALHEIADEKNRPVSAVARELIVSGLEAMGRPVAEFGERRGKRRAPASIVEASAA